MPKYLFLGGSKHGKFEEADIVDTILSFIKPLKTPDIVDLRNEPPVTEKLEYEYYHVHRLYLYDWKRRILSHYEPSTDIILITSDYNTENLLSDIIKAFAKTL